MARSPLPEPDRREDAPHPREAAALVGHAPAVAEALEAARAGRVHSGWLLAGPEGVGKATFAYRLAGTLLAGDARALGLAPDHPDARLIRAGSHPRLFTLKRGPNDKGDALSADIRVDETRRLGDFLHLAAPGGGHRVVVVDAADELNDASANAILKLLEEPPPRATFLLVSHRPGALLPTIRSRARILRFAPLPAPDLAAALRGIGQEPGDPGALAELAGGSVGAAVRLLAEGGLDAYAELVALLDGLPRLDRRRSLKVAEGAGARWGLLVELLALLLMRAARAGAEGAPPEAAPGESRLLARLAPDPRAARAWAEAAVLLPARARAGRAVNLDPAALLLDMLAAIETTAREAAAA